MLGRTCGEDEKYLNIRSVRHDDLVSFLTSSARSSSPSFSAKLFRVIVVIMVYSVAAITLFLGLSSALPTEDILNARTDHSQKKLNVQVGVRPYFLVDNMDEGSLKNKLASCSEQEFKTTGFTIGHRGAPLQFPEHTKESYKAAIRQGAGVVECDVSATKDKKLVCSESQPFFQSFQFPVFRLHHHHDHHHRHHESGLNTTFVPRR